MMFEFPEEFACQRFYGHGKDVPAINFLTETARCDSLSKVPFHKHVRVRPVGVDEETEVGEIRETALVAT